MKIKQIRVVIFLIVLGIFLIGCSGNLVDEQPVLEIDEVVEPTQVEEEQQVEEPEIIDAPSPAGRFTIMADAPLQAAVTALYEAFFDGENPLFVEDNPDLIASMPLPSNATRPILYPTFLPEAVLITITDNEDVRNFVEFAISPDGQQVLIEIGSLPAMLTLTDQAGNQVEISQPVRRVISAYGPATAIVYSVNGGDSLVSASFLGARDPQGAAAMERIDPRFPDLIGDDFFSQQEFNIEQAAMLEPDVIIAGSRSAWVDTAETLGIPVFLMEAETPEQLQEAVLLIGQLFGPHATAQAQAWVDYYNMVITAVQEQLGEISTDVRQRILFTGTEPLRVASGEMYQTDIIEAAGGVSVSAELSGYWNDINLEQVAIWDPEMIIVPPYGGASVEAITESGEWQILQAVQEGQVFRMPKLVVPWDTPAPDSVLGIIWMAELINPDQLDLSCRTETEYFYSTFYNYSISSDEIAAICAFE